MTKEAHARTAPNQRHNEQLSGKISTPGPTSSITTGLLVGPRARGAQSLGVDIRAITPQIRARSNGNLHFNRTQPSPKHWNRKPADLQVLFEVAKLRLHRLELALACSFSILPNLAPGCSQPSSNPAAGAMQTQWLSTLLSSAENRCLIAFPNHGMSNTNRNDLFLQSTMRCKNPNKVLIQHNRRRINVVPQRAGCANSSTLPPCRACIHRNPENQLFRHSKSPASARGSVSQRMLRNDVYLAASSPFRQSKDLTAIDASTDTVGISD